MATVVIDPGPRNLGIGFKNDKEIYFLRDVKNFKRMMSLFVAIIKEKLADINPFEQPEFIFERQHKSKNIYLEGLLTGLIMSMFSGAKITRLHANSKNQICNSLFAFKYVKVKSKKTLKSYPEKFFEILSTYKIFILKSDCDITNIQMAFILVTDLLLTKKTKYDDIVDVFLFLLFLLVLKK